MTLVELLTALAVSSVILLALAQSLTTATDSWTSQNKNFSAQREARTCLRLLTDDLSALVALPATQFTTAPPQPGTEPPVRQRFIHIRPQGDYQSAEIAFLRTAKGQSTKGKMTRGDLQLVMYGLAVTQDGGASSTQSLTQSQKLIRRIYTPEATWLRVRAHLEQNLPLVTEADWEALRESTPAVTPTAPEAINEAMAYDVIRFTVKPFNDILNNEPPPDPWPQDQLPDWVDVTLRVTNRATATLLRTADDWRGEGAFSTLLLNNTPLNYEDDREVRTFTLRLRLPETNL